MTDGSSHPPPRSRSEARALGLKVYRSGRACSGGHGADRLISSGKCPECVKVSKLKEQRIVARLREKLKAQARVAVMRELAREQAREVKAQAKRRECEQVQAAREAARQAAIGALPDAQRQAANEAHDKATKRHLRAEREAAKALVYEQNRADAKARFHAHAERRKAAEPQPPVDLSDHVDDGTAPWD